MHGFDYVGNSRTDLPVWRAARGAIVVSASRRLTDRVAQTTPVQRTFETSNPPLTSYLQMLRPLHWIKNTLVLLPLAAAYPQGHPQLIWRALLAFVAFSLCASSVYLLNDLLDLRADRRHPHKKARKLASGEIPLLHALLLLPMLLLIAFWLGAGLPRPFVGVLGTYFALMTAYSLGLKDVPLFDVLLLAGGYALRVVAGAIAVGVRASGWLLAVCVLLFLSLALVKRYAELMLMDTLPGERRARGYRSGDKPIVLRPRSGQWLSVGASTRAVHLCRDNRTDWRAARIIVDRLCAAAVLGQRDVVRRDARPDAPRPGRLRAHGPREPRAAVRERHRERNRAIRRMSPERVAAWLSIALLAAGVAAADSDIVDLQPFRSISRIEIESPRGPGTATLVGLNPYVNDWYLLALQIPASAAPTFYHLENPQPATQTLELDGPNGIRIVTRDHSTDCALWDARGADALAQAQRSGLPYAPLCDDRVYLRNPVAGRYTHIERITDFLRDHVWGGDQIVTFARETFFRDAFVERAAPQSGTATEAIAPAPNAPRSATIDPEFAQESVDPPHLGIDVGAAPQQLRLGAWYPVPGAAGVFISVIEPRTIDASVLKSFANIVGALDGIEADALDYLVAMDLAQFDVAFALGTEHPRVGWSERVLDTVRDPALPGPDGIGSVAPLVVNGMVSPAVVGRTVAAFAGGFKREHGAFRYGALAQQNRGTHYGFIEHGTMFSALQPGLATLSVHTDGGVYMTTWRRDDDAQLARIRYARQNGVPIIDDDPQTHTPMPGALVNRWSAGNWSGSEDERLRTLRSGACLQATASTRFLIYGYFSTATPSAMARVFQAYGCSYAMHLDMNALEHTYFALYTRAHGQLVVQHLIDGMAEVDRKGGDDLAPRFLSFPDDRDFFYLTRRATP